MKHHGGDLDSTKALRRANIEMTSMDEQTECNLYVSCIKRYYSLMGSDSDEADEQNEERNCGLQAPVVPVNSPSDTTLLVLLQGSNTVVSPCCTGRILNYEI